MSIDLATGFVWFASFLFSTTVHEAMHAVSLDSIVEFATPGNSYITTMLSVLVVQNVFLGAFNLLPLPPLDGSAVLTGLLPETHALAVRRFWTSGMMSMVGLLVAWQIFPMATDPLFSLVLRLLYPESSYY
jgi:Zn-dependent protease